MVAVGQQIGHYQILAPLGAGGMGEVFRAKDSRLDREVAVKVLPSQFASDPDRKARFEREAKAVAALSHPNILSIHDYGIEQGISFAVTELLEGETLRSRIAAGPQPWRRAVEIGIALSEGLAAAHAKGIVHRDLKPENIFLTVDGRIKILDFGLARVDLKNTAMTDTTPYTPAKTDPGAVMGTAGYMSPEQVRGQTVDGRSDLFALGCVLFELLSGRRAFARETGAETMTAILHDEPPELAGSGRAVPLEVDRTIRHCLEKNPEARFHSAHDLAFALRAIMADSGPHEMAVEPAPRWRAIALLVTGAVLSLLLLALFVKFLITSTGGQSGAASGPRIESLAVLPFENQSGDQYTGFLSDAVFENLINSLSEVRGLTVRPSTTVAKYKAQPYEITALGDELKVQAVLTGKVLQYEDDLTISVALIDAQQNSHLWGRQFPGKRSELRLLQEAMMKEIVAALQARVR